MYILFALSSVFHPLVNSCNAQDQPQGIPGRPLRVFLDGDWIDHDYTVREIPFVDFTRDPNLAELHILVSFQHTGSGGHKFTVDFIGKEKFKGQDEQLEYISGESDTDELIRKGLTHVIKMGLMPYISKTPMASSIEIGYDEEKAKSFQERTRDPWNFWIFRIDFGGTLQAEESQNEWSLTNSVSIERVTEEWKVESSFYYNHHQESYKEEDERIENIQRKSELGVGLVKSLTDHWSVGLFGNGLHSNFQNIDYEWRISPAIEYNFFPWKLSHRKVFSIGYYIGYQYEDYREETLYDRTYEHLFGEMVEARLELIQPWGELDTGVEFIHYFQDLRFYNLKADFDVSVRVTRFLSFYLEMNAESIHDQLYLPKGEASHDDILLRRRQLETSFNVAAEAGIRFTFGSIYNTIVNDRF